MIATFINVGTIILGTIIGLLLRKGLSEAARQLIFAATGVISLIIGFSLALGGQQPIALALSLIIGGLIGNALGIEAAIFRLGVWLGKRFGQADQAGRAGAAALTVDAGQSAPSAPRASFAYGFLNASILFCVGAMALVGSFKAGAEGDYTLLITKSVMDGFIAIMFSGAMGIGVGFSALSVLVYQGGLTLLSTWLKPLVSAELLTELSAIGGALVIMIGLNLLELKKIKTGDFLPALPVMVGVVILFKYIPFI